MRQPKKRSRKSGKKNYEGNHSTKDRVFIDGKGYVPKRTARFWRSRGLVINNVWVGNKKSNSNEKTNVFSDTSKPLDERMHEDFFDKKSNHQDSQENHQDSPAHSSFSSPQNSQPPKAQLQDSVTESEKIPPDAALNNDSEKSNSSEKTTHFQEFIPDSEQDIEISFFTFPEENKDYFSELFANTKSEEHYTIPDLTKEIYPGNSMTVGILAAIFVSRASKEHWTQSTLGLELKSHAAMVPDEFRINTTFPKIFPNSKDSLIISVAVPQDIIFAGAVIV